MKKVIPTVKQTKPVREDISLKQYVDIISKEIKALKKLTIQHAD